MNINVPVNLQEQFQLFANFPYPSSYVLNVVMNFYFGYKHTKNQSMFPTIMLLKPNLSNV